MARYNALFFILFATFSLSIMASATHFDMHKYGESEKRKKPIRHWSRKKRRRNIQIMANYGIDRCIRDLECAVTKKTMRFSTKNANFWNAYVYYCPRLEQTTWYFDLNQPYLVKTRADYSRQGGDELQEKTAFSVEKTVMTNFLSNEIIWLLIWNVIKLLHLLRYITRLRFD